MLLTTKVGLNNEQPILEVRGISKSFLGVRALKNVDLRIWPGEVHALMGENGAGKSILMKILSGAYGGAEPTGERKPFSWILAIASPG